MKEPQKLFNFQLPYRTYEDLRILGYENNCSVAEIVREAVTCVVEKNRIFIEKKIIKHKREDHNVI